MQDKDFGSFRFATGRLDEDGDILIRPLGGFEGGPLHTLAALRAGSSYTPGAHEYPVTIYILQGTGAIFSNGKEHEYEPGMVFQVGPSAIHGFTRVDTHTVFIKVGGSISPELRAAVEKVIDLTVN